MQPAVKPALETSKTGVVDVLSTCTIAEGSLYKRLLKRYAEDKRVITQIVPDLVSIDEKQSQHTPNTYYTSGDVVNFQQSLKNLIGVDASATQFQ